MPATRDRGRQLRRLLVVIDVLAPLRCGAIPTEVQGMLRQHDFRVSERTVRRDLYLLHSLGLMKKQRVITPRGKTFRWTLRLRESVNLQMAAIVTSANQPERRVS